LLAINQEVERRIDKFKGVTTQVESRGQQVTINILQQAIRSDEPNLLKSLGEFLKFKVEATPKVIEAEATKGAE
jgi:hypothetical protein